MTETAFFRRLRVMALAGFWVVSGLTAAVAAELDMSAGVPTGGGSSGGTAVMAPSTLAPPGTVQAEAPPPTKMDNVKSGVVASADSIDAAGEEAPPEAEFDIEQIFETSVEGDSFKSVVSGQLDLQLQRFGFDFFNGARLQPDPLAMVSPDYVIGPGDTLRIDLWGGVEGNYSATVDRNGEITLPRVGVINLWGQTFSEAKQTTQKQIAKYFKNFQINVTMGALRSIQIFVVGEASSPGTYQLSSLSTLLTALSAAGGPSSRGSLRRVQVLRQGNLVTEFDFYDFFLTGDKNRDVRLQSGDTVFVPLSGPLVGVAGNVRRPAIYEMKGGETLADCLDLAGGVNPTAYLNKVQIERVEAHRQHLVLDLDLRDGRQGEVKELAFPVQDRDLIKISPIATAGEYVTLQGYVARPGKYQLTPDMRLTDLLIPYDNLLPEYYPHAAQIIHRLPPEYRPQIVTVDLQQALEGNPQHNLMLREYDEVRLFSLEEMEEEPEVVITGAVLKPGTYQLFDHMTVKDLLTVAGNLKRGAFLQEAEITRYTPLARSTRIERFTLNLEKALADHPQHNLPLQPEDHLVVRFIPDFGERIMVVVKGEVLFPGTYAIAPGETLSSVLERAGGFTEKAYLRGAVFSRESLKEMQREHLQRLIVEEELQMARVAQDIAIGALSPEEAESAKTLLESRQIMVEKLKQTPVTGRLVVQLMDIATLKGMPQDITLLGGDEIIVPENPQTVNVQGQVYNSASLSWTPGKTAGYYLHKVGGTKKEADTGQMFVVRADGTVVSHEQTGFGIGWDSENWRWNLGGFNNLVLYPGDTILVPEKIKRFDWLSEIKDLSTIIYQMALGAAAVASF